MCARQIYDLGCLIFLLRKGTTNIRRCQESNQRRIKKEERGRATPKTKSKNQRRWNEETSGKRSARKINDGDEINYESMV